MEPTYCTEARLIDAASWMIKAAVQLRYCKSSMGRTIQAELMHEADYLLNNFRAMAAEGTSEAGAEAHLAMAGHAVLNAAGHAWYARSPHAETLLAEAIQLVRNPEGAPIRKTA